MSLFIHLASLRSGPNKQKSTYRLTRSLVRYGNENLGTTCTFFGGNSLEELEKIGTFDGLEPHFQTSATKPCTKEGTENFTGGRTKEEHISAARNYGSMEKLGARVELRNIP